MSEDDHAQKPVAGYMQSDDEVNKLLSKLQWAQESQDLFVRILALLNRQIEYSQAVRDLVGMIKDFTGFEAVGIRLRDGEDFPYFETKGFPAHFVQLEYSLCGRNGAGEIIRDPSGLPYLECMCGNVIRGRTDPSLPFFTEGGSFWSNDTSRLLATTSDKERQTKTRNRCNGEGYESVALIPLRSDNETIGLLQLNDSRENCFTLEMITLFEGIGLTIGILLERKRTEQERDRLFNLSIDMLCIAGFDGFFKQVNPAFTKILGWTQHEFLAKRWMEFVHPDDVESTINAGNMLVSGKALHGFENRYAHKDGSYRWISWNCFPISGEQLVFAVARDVTWDKQAREDLRKARDELEKRVEERTAALKQLNQNLTREIFEREWAENALKMEREQLLSIFDSINEVILVIDPITYEILYTNQFTKELYGKELIGGHCYEELTGGAASPCARCCNETVVQLSGKPHQREYHNSVVNRDYFATDKIIKWPDGRDAIFHLAIDITDRKRAEQEQENLRSQLLQAQKMEAIGTLAGGIAHDFNNLLTVILGFSDLLLMGEEETDPAYSDLQKINEAARNGAELVQRILAFSRKTEINARPLNLKHEIAQAKKLLDRTIPKMIELKVKYSDKLATVNADPIQVEQVLMNLAVNAKDAMPDGGMLVIEARNIFLDEEYCRMHLGSKPGNYVMLSVSDTGQGMDEQTLNNMFTPFFTTKEPGSGTGLGLAMVYGMVKQHEGYITCSSAPGVGTTFEIYLPVTAGEAKSAPEAAKPAFSHGSAAILIVDDEVTIREIARRILERSGYTVFTATNGKEAIELFNREKARISLVILDLIMPGMGGKQCFEELLKIDPQVKVLVASGYSSTSESSRIAEGKTIGSIRKPYNMTQLLQMVREALTK
ncbi:MAG: PAS domain S-box protein [Desulfomonile tiedjei]|uniref:histidine kinase n=1 Tax=Desulfomonile tiedjei TaxID=2358 RepID=A0A9D6UZH7_9BACT|nr:PAS domain S-box protein [Desulfomonile tiedjei]